MGKNVVMTETLVQKIAEHAAEKPDRTAVIFKKDELTYRELFARICSAGRLLQEMGIRPRDRVMYTSVSKTENTFVHFGIQYFYLCVLFDGIRSHDTRTFGADFNRFLSLAVELCNQTLHIEHDCRNVLLDAGHG